MNDPFNKQQILIINSGSSSLKVTLFQHYQTRMQVLWKIQLKNMHLEECCFEISSLNQSTSHSLKGPISIKDGLIIILDELKEKEILTPQIIGHRYVHGGNQYISPVKINENVIQNLEKLSYLAPLHNQACLEGIKCALHYFGPFIPQVAVFDTSFHHTLPKVASQYAIDYRLSEKYNIKRYGFHGISNAFLWNCYHSHFGKTAQHANIIIMHLGNGCSITAIKEGISIDTSMGFTPAEGLVMATRAGDIDASVVEFLSLQMDKTSTEIMDILNFQSGLKGVSGISSDMKILLDEAKQNEKAQLAIDMFCYRIVKYLGAYIAILGNVDAFIFSGGIGENASQIRQRIIAQMHWYGLNLDSIKNEEAVALTAGTIQKISSDNGGNVYVIPTDENLFIAKEIRALV